MQASPPLEVWGGHECTVNRIGDHWRDQTVLSGHQARLDDLDLFAGLGLAAVRYPVLWERTELAPGQYDWTWADKRLGRLRGLGVRPIVGLLHHGSGPAWTNLADPSFPQGLAAFARAVATRYPWIRDWTPVNEPLTTARFGALYGHWHPHARDEPTFWLALFHQIEATAAAMQAIREINPAARLIQTEDWGRTLSTEPCASQAAFDHDRALMTWDLLVGRVIEGHPLRNRLLALGFGARLDALNERPCFPDVIGLNHYITSDRFLDHRLGAYPAHTHGGNEHLAYADVEAVRVAEDLPCGWSAGLRTLWERYRIPIAVTECHLGGDSVDQVHWLRDCWNAALAARSEGVEVEAVTAWSLLGSYDWDSLLTRCDGRYESGAFSVASGQPRETPLAEEVRRLGTQQHLATLRSGLGWWRNPDRLSYPPWRDARTASTTRLSPTQFSKSHADPALHAAERQPVS